MGIGKFVSLFSIIILSIVITQPIFAERQIEVITEFDKETEQMILTLKGTDFYPDLEILWVIVHDVGIDFTIANGKTNSDAQGNFLDSSNVKLFAESGNYIIRVIDVERHEFKERLELNDFPDDAISWTLTPKNFKVGESTVIDIKGTVNVDIDYNRDVMIRVDQPDHQWAAVAERVSLTDDNKFHIAKNVSFRVPGEHLVIIEHNGLIRQNSFTVFTDEPEPESLCGAGTVFDPATNSCVLDKCGTGTVLKDGVCVLQESEPESLCGAGTVFDPATNSCVLDKCGTGTVLKDGVCVLQESEPESPKEKIPVWIKNNAKWWSEDQIDDDTFVRGIQFLMKEKIINIPDLPEQASEKARPSFVDESKNPQSYVDRYNNEESYKEWFDKNYPDYTIYEVVGVTTPIPGWIKNNAEWWSQGLITDDDFIKGIEFLVEKRILNVESISHSKPQSESEQSTQQEQTFSFDESKKSVLSDLVKIEQSHNFDIVFDKDLTSKQKEGAIFHTYKIIHETDGRIGDLTFYFGKPYFLMFPSTDFDKIFRVKIFISNEYGVAPTSSALPIIKSSLEELVPEWNMIHKDQTSSGWIDAVIQYGQSDSSGEKNETIRSDQQEIKFAYNEEGLGFVELIITQKIS